ncbi:hypothetical protein EG68_06755 [Paragonimus skrjabini miyazakii]|uniref:Uncharacterized protein n=1 Tax=Paragonimus skrjabini miyazakii TaxID=59628 RepID=A0A8S9YT83_9TREM|nr:hypothetical protein EG68_06755 [Paragonimus skrjabini miyazakii]
MRFQQQPKSVQLSSIPDVVEMEIVLIH